MGVPCEKCGHENDAKFLFCGMCGERLPSVQWQDAETEPNPPLKPSPGLLFPPADDADTRAAYLLKDDEEEAHPRHTGRLYLALVFLLVSLVLLAIHWRQYAHSWISEYVARSAATNPGDDPAGTPGQAQPPTSVDSVATQPGATKPNATTNAPPKPSLPVSTKPLPAELRAQNPPTDASPQEAPAQTAENKRPAPDDSMPAPPKPRPTSTPAAVLPPGESLVAQGERYLYGNGVPEDCALARKKLAQASDHKNARALTLMGTMYATGHCADRDLPTAYGWFAKALRADPGNRRIEDDLSLIWRQMTPGEKQIALKK